MPDIHLIHRHVNTSFVTLRIPYIYRRMKALANFLGVERGEGLGLGWFKNGEDGLIGELGRIFYTCKSYVSSWHHKYIANICIIIIKWHCQMEYHL